jgi:hypothetical protein
MILLLCSQARYQLIARDSGTASFDFDSKSGCFLSTPGQVFINLRSMAQAEVNRSVHVGNVQAVVSANDVLRRFATVKLQGDNVERHTAIANADGTPRIHS